LVRHPAVVSLLAFSLTLVIGSTFGLVAGYPDAAAALFPPFVVLEFACLGISVMVITSGISTDRAIEYAGHYFGNRIRRSIKAPLVAKKVRQSIVQRTLAAYGFHLRDLDRLAVLQPTSAKISVVERYLMALFNAASRGIQEGQQEVLRASLQAVVDCASAYTERRRYYTGSQDEVFRFMNDLLAATMKSAAKASNEGLITDVIANAGFIGRLSLRVGTVPSSPGLGGGRPEFVSRSHPLAAYWIDLLKSGFYVSHTLTRSTAPSTAVWQIGLLAGAATKMGYSEVVRFAYLPAIEELHTLCFANPDAYHIDLSGQCLQNILTVWLYAVAVADPESFHEIHEDTVRAVLRMSSLHMELPSSLSLIPNLSDMTSVLTTKLDVERPILQDIFVLIAKRQRKEPWEDRAAAEQLVAITKLTTDLGRKSVEKRQPLAAYYCHVLYEMAYCASFMEHALSADGRRQVQGALLDSWKAIVPVYYAGHPVSTHDWEQSMFGILGLGMGGYEVRPEATLGKQLLDCAQLYVHLVKSEYAEPSARVGDQTWDYLQLLGAWVKTFLGDEKLSAEIAETIAYGRPFISGVFGIAPSRVGRYGSLGYPTNLFQDYSLPQLRNIGVHLSPSDIENFQRIQDRLISDGTLLPFAQEVRTIRRRVRIEMQERRSQSTSEVQRGNGIPGQSDAKPGPEDSKPSSS